MRFMMFMIPEGYGSAAPGTAPDLEAVKRMTAYNKTLQDAGVLEELEGLHPPSEGVRLRFGGAKPRISDGPFSEAKEVVGGYWVIRVNSKEEAVDWAAKCPAGPGDTIELRQIRDLDAYPPEMREAAAL
jgi:hypothetical protein